MKPRKHEKPLTPNDNVNTILSLNKLTLCTFKRCKSTSNDCKAITLFF